VTLLYKFLKMNLFLKNQAVYSFLRSPSSMSQNPPPLIVQWKTVMLENWGSCDRVHMYSVCGMRGRLHLSVLSLSWAKWTIQRHHRQGQICYSCQTEIVEGQLNRALHSVSIKSSQNHRVSLVMILASWGNYL